MTQDKNLTEHTDTQSTFWLVWCPMHDAPLKSFDSIFDAEKEAEQLAKEFKKKHFYVLKAVSKVNVEFQVYKTSFE
jgi:hypothetical protein